MGPGGLVRGAEAGEERDALGNTPRGKHRGEKETTGRGSDLGRHTVHGLLSDQQQGYLGAWGAAPHPTQNGTSVRPRRCLQTPLGRSRRHPEHMAPDSALTSNSERQGERRRALRTNKNSSGAQGTGFLARPPGSGSRAAGTRDINAERTKRLLGSILDLPAFPDFSPAFVPGEAGNGVTLSRGGDGYGAPSLPIYPGVKR